jgi:serine/threonine protein kinase
MYNDLRSSLYVRGSDDDIHEESMFTYKYLRSHLLSFAQRDVSLPMTKRTIRDALRGIADSHAKDIVHTDVKANNILVDWHGCDGEVVVRKVQVADIEDAAYLPENGFIRELQLRNHM